MEDDNRKAMWASEGSPKLHSRIFNKVKSTTLNIHQNKHLQKFAETTKHQAGKQYQNHKNRKERKGIRTEGLNDQVSLIAESTEMSNNEKISQLQDLLNKHHKEISPALHQRIKNELRDIHQYIGSSKSEHIENPYHAELYGREQRILHSENRNIQAETNANERKLDANTKFLEKNYDQQEELNTAVLNTELEHLGYQPNQPKTNAERENFDKEQEVAT